MIQYVFHCNFSFSGLTVDFSCQNTLMMVINLITWFYLHVPKVSSPRSMYSYYLIRSDFNWLSLFQNLLTGFSGLVKMNLKSDNRVACLVKEKDPYCGDGILQVRFIFKSYSAKLYWCFNLNHISNLPCLNKNDVSFQNEFHRMMKNVIVDQYFSVLRQDQVVYHQKEKEKEKKNAKKILI